MPAPQEITHASRQYEAYATTLMAEAMLATHNQAYAMTRAVLHETRDHLGLAEGIRFARGLPAVLRAMFVEGWDPAQEPRLYLGEGSFRLHVVNRLTPHHVPPDTIVADVTGSIRKVADPHDFSVALTVLPPGLKRLWES